MTFTLHSVKHHETKRRSKPHTGWASYFHVTLRPNPNTTDAFDPELFYQQALCFVLQQWHKHRNDQFFQPFPANPSDRYDCALYNPETLKPVSTNPWTPHIQLLLPATNAFNEKARGILMGPTPALFQSNRRTLDHITEQLYLAFRPALANPANIRNNLYYPTLHSFRQDVGVRPAYFPHSNYNNKNNKKQTAYKVYYVSTSHIDIWKLLIRINKPPNATKPTDIDGIPFELLAFPHNPSAILPLIAAIHQSTREFKLIATKRFKIPMSSQHRAQILALPTVKALIPVFPLHSNEPVAHRLALLPTPQTVGIQSDTLHQLTGIPQEALIPINDPDGPPHYATAARNPPKPTEPLPGLAAFQSRWTTFTDTTPPTPTTLRPLKRTAPKKPRTIDSTASHSTDNSTALLSTASHSTPPHTLDDDDDMHSLASTDSTHQQNDSQMTDFGGLDELIYQFIEDHATDNAPLRRRIEALLQQSPRPFRTFAEFEDLIGAKDNPHA